MFDLIKTRRNSQAARASVLYTLKTEIYPLGDDNQVRVVRELVKDLQAALREHKRHTLNNKLVGIKDAIRQQRVTAEMVKK